MTTKSEAVDVRAAIQEKIDAAIAAGNAAEQTRFVEKLAEFEDWAAKTKRDFDAQDAAWAAADAERKRKERNKAIEKEIAQIEAQRNAVAAGYDVRIEKLRKGLEA